MSSINSPRAVKEKPLPYEKFIGLETMRDSSNQDTGTKQPLLRLSNGYVDGLGQVIRMPGMDRVHSAVNVIETRHFSLDDLTWIEQANGGTILRSSSGRVAPTLWDSSAIPTVASFAGNLYYFSQAQPVWRYSGANFSIDQGPLTNRLRPSFGCTVQSRLVVGGLPYAPGVIDISRVNDPSYFADDEKSDEESVNRAGKIDIWSVIGKRETITGITAFETNKLVIFTASRGLIYRISTDIDQWAIEDRTSITNGCISHRTVVEAGQDIIYCSRTGVYTVARSRDNGTMVASASLSDNISLLYKKLLRTVPDPRLISAVWDADASQYHIFFPQTQERSFRLTMTVDPTNPLATARWSLSELEMSPICGDFFEGNLVFGSFEGLYQVGQVDEDTQEFFNPLVFETPTLYLGSFVDSKDISGLLISASGNAVLLIEMIDNASNRVVWSRKVEINEDAIPGSFFGTPLSQHRRIPMNVRTTACRFRFTAEGAGLFRLAGFAPIVGS